MHRALAQPTENPDFAPERLAETDLVCCGRRHARAGFTRARRLRRIANASEPLAALVEAFLNSAGLIDAAIDALTAGPWTR